MRFFAAALLLLLVGLQYRLWISDDGIRAVVTLKGAVAEQTGENTKLLRRNGQLVAEVRDLKEGMAALEERARNDLGMIGANETFFQVVDAEPRTNQAPAAPAPPPPERLPIQRTSR